jgi:hypothetical protein
MAKFKHVQGKNEGFKSRLEINFYHPLQNVITIVLNGTKLNLERMFDFFDYMKFMRTPQGDLVVCALVQQSLALKLVCDQKLPPMGPLGTKGSTMASFVHLPLAILSASPSFWDNSSSGPSS